MKARLELAEVKSSDIVYDLGCGDGRIVIAAVKSYVAGGVGIDIDPVLIREAKNNARQVGIDSRVESRQQDLVPGEPPRGNGGYSVPVSGCRPAPAPVAGNPCGKSSSKTTLTTTTISAAAVSFSGSFRNASSCAVQPG